MTTFAADLRTHFSVGESLLVAEDAAQLVADARFDAGAIVDTMSISGMPDFTKAADAAGIKPVIGVRLRIVENLEEERRQRTVFPVLYILTEEGFRIVTRLLSVANDTEHFYYRSRLTWADVYSALAGARGHVAFASGTLYSALRDPWAGDVLENIKGALGRAHTLIEITPCKSAVWDRQALLGYQLAEKLDLPVLLARPAIFEARGMWDRLGVMNAIASNAKHRGAFGAWVDNYTPEPPRSLITDAVEQFNRLRRDYGLDVPANRLKASQDVWGALVDDVSFKWAKLDVSLPRMAEDEDAELRKMAIEGLRRRLTSDVFGYRPPRSQLETYRDRLRYELQVLTDMGFSGYFLLVNKIVQFSKESGIMVGPGRGSVGGSLLAYALGITEVDPIRFGLIFERFINPERIDLPDIDLDFMSERRHEIIEYLEREYGEDRVANISNYTMLGSRSVLQDVTRILEMPFEDRNLSKKIPEEQGTPIPLERAFEEVPEVKEFAGKNKRAWELCIGLEGKLRTLSKHAAGVVVAGEPLTQRAVVEYRSGESTVNWDKRVVEDMGLVKIDVLGLSTLDLIKHALRKVAERGAEVPDINAIPLDDPAVLAEFGRGRTVGVFQFEGGSAQKMLVSSAKEEPLTFKDIVAANALNRPGPIDSGMVDDFIAIRNGEMAPQYDHPRMKPALESSYGLMIYQESVMQVSRDLCGFSMPDADRLRKAMGKKDAKAMAELQEKFIAGAQVGYARVGFDDGASVEIHRGRKLRVEENEDTWTIDQVAENDFTLKPGQV